MTARCFFLQCLRQQVIDDNDTCFAYMDKYQGLRIEPDAFSEGSAQHPYLVRGTFAALYGDRRVALSDV